MKVCPKCSLIKEYNEFPNNKSAKDGKGNYCKLCRKNIDTKYRQSNPNLIKQQTELKRNKIDSILKDIRNLKGNKCLKCKESREHLLDFHHLDKTTKIGDIPRMLFLGGFSLKNIDKVENEANKCILLCSNCHRDFHYLERKNNINLEEYL